MYDTDILSRLNADERALYEDVVKKYPRFDFSIQPCDTRRFNLVMDYMRQCRWDPSVQRLLALSGRGWLDVHMIVAAISRSRGDYKRQQLSNLGEWVPPLLTDELKPLAERVDPEGSYSELARQLLDERHARQMAEIKLQLLEPQLTTERERADKAFDFIRQLSEQMAQEGDKWRESLAQFLSAHPAAQAADVSQLPQDEDDDGDLQQTKSSGDPSMVERLFENWRADQFRRWIKDAKVREWFADVLEKARDSDEAVFVHTDALLDRKGCLLDDIDLPEFARAMSAACKNGKGCSAQTLRDKLHDLFLQRMNRK